MSISTGNWFEYLREEVLTEGLRDIGLPESVVDFIEAAMPQAPEKAKTYAGNEWKKWELPRNGRTFAQRNWEGFMERIFRDEIQVIPPEERSAAGNAPYRARTMTPYYVGGVDGKPVVRKEYDDEMIEQNKRIVFVAQNVANVLAKPSGAWRKAFMKAVKALSKAGVESEKVEEVKEELAATMIREFKGWWYNYDTLFSWLNDEPTNYELIKGEADINSAFNIAKEELENKEDPDMVIHQFDNGLYWYNLNTYNCSVEGERMGHCGSDSRGVLVSLRERKGKRKASSSYVTMTWNADERILYQIKGRSNNAPDEELWEYISWFIQNSDIRSVMETGEHSNDLSGFEEMNEYLQGENPDVNFEGVLDVDGIQEAVDEVVNNYEGEYTGIYAEVQDPDDWGGDGQTAYIYVSCDMSFDVNLGWPGIVRRDNDYYSADEADSGDINDLLDFIPYDSYGTTARDFRNEAGLDDLGYELPGDDAEVEYEVQMLQGVQPDDEEYDADFPKTAHLRVRIRSNEPLSVDNADDATSEVEFIARELRNLEDDVQDYIQAVRSQLVDGEYIAKGVYDRTRGDLVDKRFEHWLANESSGGALEFAWRIAAGAGIINDGGQIPQVIQMYGQDYDRNITELYTRIFGSPMSNTNPPRLENYDLNRNMARNLEKLYSAKQENPAQQQMGFGSEYAAKAARIILAKDSHFIIQGSNSAVGQNSKYPTQPISWMYKINMNHQTSEEEIQVTQDILDFFNENPEMMNQAAEQTIKDAVSGILALAEARKADISSGRQPFAQIRQIENMFTPVQDTADGMKAMMIARWINQNFEQMDEIEKYVSYYKYLRPIAGQRIRSVGPIAVEGDDAGKPDYFDQEVRTQLIKMGATSSQMDTRKQDPISGRVGTPRPAGEPSHLQAYDDDVRESVEDQIDRIDALLKEKDDSYDLRLYSIKVDVAIQKNIGGEVQETQTEIRGIEGVTTVRTAGDTTDAGTSTVATYEIKFELLGAISRVKYRDRVLIPGLMKVRGLRILRVSPMHRTNARGTIRTVREALTLKEGSMPFGGRAASLGAVRYGTHNLRTPSAGVQQVADDWAANGVMDYDRPMANSDMQYHVMVDTSELVPYMSRVYRNPKDAFDADYQHFIKTGPSGPVYVAVGKNGRVKITGNEDIVWFAKKSGLEQVPVFFSYQMQV